MKIAVGTVQFGLAYGAFNQVGQVSVTEVRQILELAKTAGVSLLDTANAYGNSEAVLGEVAAGDYFRLVTKIPALVGVDPVNQIRKFFSESLLRLRVNKVHGLLLHRAADLVGPNGAALWRLLEELRDSGKINKIGFSAYGPEEAKAVMEQYPVQLIQLPANVFDTRHLDAGVLDICHSQGIEVHVRSVFLQGFILSNPEYLSGHLSAWRDLLSKFQTRCIEMGVSPLQAALQYIMDLPQVDQVIVGVDRCSQLTEILQASKSIPLSHTNMCDFASKDLQLIDPSKWQQ